MIDYGFLEMLGCQSECLDPRLVEITALDAAIQAHRLEKAVDCSEGGNAPAEEGFGRFDQIEG